jgi:hypothetical protein
MAAVSEGIRGAFNPKTTVIISFDSHFLGYRHAGYYLPEFETVQYPEATYKDGKRVFILQGRDTRLVRRFSLDSYDRFTFFPLPKGKEYEEYLAEVVSKLPAGLIHDVTIADRRVVTGPAQLLPLLFPSTLENHSAPPTAGR